MRSNPADAARDPLPILLSVVVVNWNARGLLADCLTSLRRHAGVATEVIVVDNASTDGSLDLIRAEFPEVRLIANHENRGFAGANNQAAQAARGEFLLLLNPDAQVLPGAVGRLIDFASAHADVAAIGPRLLNPDGTAQRSCWRGYPGLGAALVDALYLWKVPWLPLVNRSEYKSDELQVTREVDHLLGACMLIPRAAWDAVGPMDDGYFLFLEETDWCRRARASGRRVFFLPEAAILHQGQHSMRQQPARNLPHLYRSYCRFYRRSPSSSRLGLVALKGVIALAIALRFLLWSARRLLARDARERAHAVSMRGGYHRAFRELPSM